MRLGRWGWNHPGEVRSPFTWAYSLALGWLFKALDVLEKDARRRWGWDQESLVSGWVLTGRPALTSPEAGSGINTDSFL